MIFSEIAFVLWMGLLYFGIGSLAIRFIPKIPNQGCFFIASILGLCVVSILGNFLYYCNLSTYIIFVFFNILSIPGILHFIKNQRNIVILSCNSKISLLLKNSNWSTCFVCLASLALLIIPGLIGSTQFVLFRGNHYDAFNYLEMASTYTRFTHHQVVNLNTQSLTSLHGFYTAAWYMHERPLVAIVYAILEHFNPTEFTHLHYYYLTYSLFLAGGLLGSILCELTGQLKHYYCYIAGFCFALGFWGQYILDLDAWSQVVWTPIELLFIISWIKFCIKMNQPTKANNHTGALLSYLITLSVCSLCMYFEGYLFFGFL